MTVDWHRSQRAFLKELGVKGVTCQSERNGRFGREVSDNHGDELAWKCQGTLFLHSSRLESEHSLRGHRGGVVS